MHVVRWVLGSVRDLVRLLTLERSIWSWVVIVTGLSRAVSYLERPPQNPSPASERIEGSFSYDTWAVLLVTYSVVIAIGIIRRNAPIAWAGHMLGLGVTSILAFSILGATVFDGNGWSALGPLVVVGLVHWGRIMALGSRIANKPKDEEREKRTESKA